MHLGRPANKNTLRIIWGAIGFLALLYIIFFWKEIGGLLGFLPAAEKQELILIVTCLGGFFAVFILWVVLISFQALLPISDFLDNPVQSLLEAYRTGWHLIVYILHMHGPAIFVKDGKENASPDDLKREEWPGVVVVDFNSAVVLEERNPPPGLNRLLYKLLMSMPEAFLLSDPYESPRVRGAGIIFTRPRERIRGVVDLRKQARRQSQVRCYTRDGIELYADVSAVFTVGENPDILQVAYEGNPQPENLRVVSFTIQPDGSLHFTGFSDELDEDDRNEIHTYAQNAVRQSYTPLPNTNVQRFITEQVFAAVYAQARNGDQEALPWTELPTRVAAGFYREILAQTNYDDLYNIKNGDFPLPGYRSKLMKKMRNNGILAFRLIFLTTGKTLRKGAVYREANLLVSPVQPLQNSQLLRDRGIKVVSSSFGDLTPVNDAIYQQRLDSWRAAWEMETDVRLANGELEAMRVLSRARAEAQQELCLSLSQIFSQHEHSDEALAIRILQALDQAAADPKTRALLPANTIDWLRQINMMLLPSETPQPNLPGPRP